MVDSLLFSITIYIDFFLLYFFFFNDTATTEIYTLSLHDALPIWTGDVAAADRYYAPGALRDGLKQFASRSEEHTSELQSHSDLVCRLLLEKKKKKKKNAVYQKIKQIKKPSIN